MTDEQPRIYTDLADWFHLLTAPAEYAEEAEFYLRTIAEALGHRPLTLLELGAGGGNNAWHYKRTVERVTLTDLSPRMLALSERINPECEHIIGDMRSARLSREFDAVFIHDAGGLPDDRGRPASVHAHRIRALPTWRGSPVCTGPRARDLRRGHRSWRTRRGRWPRVALSGVDLRS
jgi:hypothetical protein